QQRPRRRLRDIRRRRFGVDEVVHNDNVCARRRVIRPKDGVTARDPDTAHLLVPVEGHADERETSASYRRKERAEGIALQIKKRQACGVRVVDIGKDRAEARRERSNGATWNEEIYVRDRAAYRRKQTRLTECLERVRVSGIDVTKPDWNA